MSDLRITGPDRRSALWLSIRDHYTKRLEELRAQNDKDKTPEQTAKLRGQIHEVKALLSMGEDSLILPD